MTDEIAQFIEATVEPLKPLEKAYNLASWEAAVSGSPEANRREKETQAAQMRFLADPERHATAKRLRESGKAADPLTARQLKIIYLVTGENQQDEATIQQLTRLEAEIREQYYNFRGEVGGKKLSDNELDGILTKSRDSAEVQAVWEASKQVGAQVADQVRELARVRNAAARAQGFRDHFQRSLTLNEIDEGELLALFAQLEAATHEPFARLKAEVDAARAAHFGIPVSALRP